jgi:hypothetical protein
MEPALIRNQNCTSGALPSPLPAAAGRRHLPLTSARRRVAHPVFGTEMVGLATDTFPPRRAPCRPSPAAGAIGVPYIPLFKGSEVALSLRGIPHCCDSLTSNQRCWPGKMARKRPGPLPSPLCLLRSFASHLTVERSIDYSRPLFADLPPLELPKMVAADEAATARGVISLSRTWDWTDLRDRARH